MLNYFTFGLLIALTIPFKKRQLFYMKPKHLVFPILILLTFMFGSLKAQCSYSIEVSNGIIDGKGYLNAKIENSTPYKCVLYAYEDGNKFEVSRKSSKSDNVGFGDLLLNRYYKLEITFDKKDDLLCFSWVSELINFND